LQVIAFCLARSWFGCRLAPQIEVAAGDLPAEVVRWFDRYAAAPMEALFRPNKHEIWLHLALVESARDKRAVLRRRLLPLRPPGQVDSVHVPEEQLTFRLRVRRRWRYAVYVAERCRHHASVLPGFVFHWIRWRSPFGELSKGFWVYLTTASFFNLGLFLFYLIYNLHLMDRGFQESFLGVMNGAFTAGSVSGALPAGAMLQRLGLTRMLQFCIGSTVVVGAFRVLIPSADALIGLAFMAGAAFSLWVVSIPPAIAQLTSESVRPRAFSTFFGVSIAIGVVGGLAGGHMPQWLATPEVSGKQAALLVGCGLMAIALWPAARLRFGAAPSRVRLRYPLGSFVRRFLISLVGWNFAVGAFNPFFNTFFSRHLHARIEDIGAIFSSGQVAQVVAMAAAPVVLNRLGLVSGVTATQVATGLALAALAWSSALWVAAIAYAVYAACQYMSEPGIYSLLMSRVRPDEQSGASSLNFFAAFTAQAMAAALAGIALSRYGYQTVVALIAVLIVLSSLLFRTLLTGYERRE
jgi:predicted MFS family arabinose efflux permease